MRIITFIVLGCLLGYAWSFMAEQDYKIKRAELEERVAAHCQSRGESMVTTKSGKMVCVRSLQYYTGKR